MKRGLHLSPVCSALATTRREQLQLSRVPNTRCPINVRTVCSIKSAARSSAQQHPN